MLSYFTDITYLRSRNAIFHSLDHLPQVDATSWPINKYYINYNIILYRYYTKHRHTSNLFVPKILWSSPIGTEYWKPT